MDYDQSDPENFKLNFSFFNEHITGEVIKRAYISVGSNLFIKFGEEFESKFPNGKLCKKSPWTIWLGGNVQWRLARNGEFVVGSCQPYDQMNSEVQKLVGKKLLSSCIISQQMDIQFEFEGGYQLTGFLNVLLQHQWVLFCSNGNTAAVEAETIEEVKAIEQLSHHFTIKNEFQEISLPIDQKKLLGFYIEEEDDTELDLDFEGDISLILSRCAWSIEKNGEYCIGSGDHFLKLNKNVKQSLKEMVGQKLIKSSTTHPFQDTKFEFENGYVIKTVTCHKEEHPWRILNDDDEMVYAATIALAPSAS